MDVKSFNKSFENQDIPLKYYFLIVLLFIIMFLYVIICNNNFTEYYKGYGIISSNIIRTNILLSDIEKIINNKNIEIGGTTYAYELNSIEDGYVYDNDVYKIVNIKIIDSFEYQDNNYITYNIIIDKDTLVNYFIRTIKGE